MRLFRADEIVLSLGNEVSQWQEEVSIGPGRPARRNRIFGSGEIRDPENNVVFLDDMQPGDFFLIKKKKKTSIAWAWDGHSRCDPMCRRVTCRRGGGGAGYRWGGTPRAITWAASTRGPWAWRVPCSWGAGLPGPHLPGSATRPGCGT